MSTSNVDIDVSKFLRNEIGASDVMSLPNALRILRIIQDNLDKNGYEIIKSKEYNNRSHE